jgi:predicted nucleotidyltransferase
MIHHHLWQQCDSNADGRITLPLSTERCLIWNDPTIGIAWPLEGEPMLSSKDRQGVTFDRAAAVIRQVYGDRLVSVVLYGSVGRGTMRQDSDVDLLIIARDLPRGRMNRVTEFEAVKAAVADDVEQARRAGVRTELSPILKTPEEAMAGSPLFLDMIDDARILYDRDGFFARRLALLRERLAQLGAKRLWRGNTWYWDLKPDFRPGEVFEL